MSRPIPSSAAAEGCSPAVSALRPSSWRSLGRRSTADEPTAVASFNYHREHFSSVYDLTQPDGEQAHTACVGFGLERITLALLSRHGLDVDRWPGDVTAELWPARTSDAAVARR